MALPLESCQDCGKTISRRAVANVWDGERVVCTTCNRKLDRERKQREALASARSAPATERQKAYASDLGLHFHANITSQAISDLIDERVNPPASPELLASARAWGLSPRDGVRSKYLEEQIRTQRAYTSWVYSVLRQMHDARWILLSDCPIAFPALLPVVSAIAADKSLRSLVDDVESADVPDWFYDAEESRGLEQATDYNDWYFFGEGGASTRSKAYVQTKALIERLLQGGRLS